jgi:hypothetical protein
MTPMVVMMPVPMPAMELPVNLNRVADPFHTGLSRGRKRIEYERQQDEC